MKRILDQSYQERKLCEYFIWRFKLCNHPLAPRPCHSKCIGTVRCKEYKQRKWSLARVDEIKK